MIKVEISIIYNNLNDNKQWYNNRNCYRSKQKKIIDIQTRVSVIV